MYPLATPCAVPWELAAHSQLNLKRPWRCAGRREVEEDQTQQQQTQQKRKRMRPGRTQKRNAQRRTPQTLFWHSATTSHGVWGGLVQRTVKRNSGPNLAVRCMHRVSMLLAEGDEANAATAAACPNLPHARVSSWSTSMARRSATWTRVTAASWASYCVPRLL